ncbi:hypothetical protein TREMEDRAFT_59079 [Tremella mesenterica DSM 1558]|uniref:uncharacterized protein n=1 Tax=Tremella mesenterica (strain ATCC 24925 / CBS 8224 / DSM 1558 / NBRC 9311 / NRRL Y-6157 / RJB 2259-6 / UBC 559-6) TaxID=578456 RepID=UPI0003F49398|nr:uncharacterized protein TREMEDRAFT_59079 [Tremella mesenterica DSM 1558]EIW72918.1 hypothetical protein TREMEDRAFT_59079 [Tremella mesenterica DSM 1558]
MTLEDLEKMIDHKTGNESKLDWKCFMPDCDCKGPHNCHSSFFDRELAPSLRLSGFSTAGSVEPTSPSSSVSEVSFKVEGDEDYVVEHSPVFGNEVQTDTGPLAGFTIFDGIFARNEVRDTQAKVSTAKVIDNISNKVDQGKLTAPFSPSRPVKSIHRAASLGAQSVLLKTGIPVADFEDTEELVDDSARGHMSFHSPDSTLIGLGSPTTLSSGPTFTTLAGQPEGRTGKRLTRKHMSATSLDYLGDESFWLKTTPSKNGTKVSTSPFLSTRRNRPHTYVLNAETIGRLTDEAVKEGHYVVPEEQSKSSNVRLGSAVKYDVGRFLKRVVWGKNAHTA